jgi:hypothetical protein
MSDGKEWMGWKQDTKIRNEGNKISSELFQRRGKKQFSK